MIASIVVNYFGSHLTKSATDSLLRDRPNMEVIVIDNSTDAEESLKLRQVLDPRIKLIINSSNTGFGAACNLGFVNTQAKFVMLLNPDAQVMPGCLDSLQAALEHQQGLGAVSPAQFWEPSLNWRLPPAWLPTGVEMWCMEQAWRQRKAAQKMSTAYRNMALQAWQATGTEVLPQRALSGGAVLLRRSAVEQAGGLFDPAFFMYYEDSDLCWRLRRSGWKLGLSPSAHVLHEWVHSPAKVDFMEKSKRIYIDKHFMGRGTWQQRLERCTSEMPLAEPLSVQFHDSARMALEIPAPWQACWLLEISPSPLLIPALGCLGSGPTAEIPPHLMERLGSGTLYARIGPGAATRYAHQLPVFRLTPI